MAQKLIIDADPGIGDALAITLAMLDPELDVLAVTATAGCVSGETATRNIQAIIESTDPAKWPRVGSSEAPSVAENLSFAGEIVSPTALNGPSGLGDHELRVADLHHRHESAKVMTDIVRNYPHEVTILSLGPLSNVALAMERTPDFLNLLGGIVCLGGSVEYGGDVTAAAEFNIYAAPEAARTVLRSACTKTLVPLDTSSQAILTFELWDRMCAKSSSAIQFLERLLPYSFRAHHEHLGLEGVRLHEVVALAAVTHAAFFDRRSMAVDVEVAGEITRGMTVFDRRGLQRWQSNIDVLTDVDVQGVLDYFTRTLRLSCEL